MGASGVLRCVKHFQDGNTTVHHQPRSAHPPPASAEKSREKVDQLIKADRRLSEGDFAIILGVGHHAVQ